MNNEKASIRHLVYNDIRRVSFNNWFKAAKYLTYWKNAWKEVEYQNRKE